MTVKEMGTGGWTIPVASPFLYRQADFSIAGSQPVYLSNSEARSAISPSFKVQGGRRLRRVPT